MQSGVHRLAGDFERSRVWPVTILGLVTADGYHPVPSGSTGLTSSCDWRAVRRQRTLEGPFGPSPALNSG
jgi:hypothetical protein